MRKRLFIWLQHTLPQHALTRFVGRIASVRQPWFKNALIKQFIKIYKVNMAEAISDDVNVYPSFNDFFIRQLKPGIRPIAQAANAIVSPADGTIAQIGVAEKDRLLQAKGFYFDLKTLLGNDDALAKQFHSGPFATVYLAPYDYHRVHMPLSGRLLKTIYVPGRLFSVNATTSENIPELYSRNERLICIFDTDVGLAAIVLVGAMIVGSIQTVWMQEPIRGAHPLIETFDQGITLEKGAELGFFKMGSTVILLFGKGRIEWKSGLGSEELVQVGEEIGSFPP